MKKGITSTIAFELEIEVTDVAEVIFTFKEKIDSEEYLLQKSYPEEVSFEDNKFLCKLTQEETDSLTNTFFVEAQINLSNKSVIKSDICKKIMPPTLWTTFVEDNESSGEEEIISLTFTDYVEGGGSGGTTNYNELSNKPRYNGIEWVGNKTDSDMGIATKGELQTKADKSDTYTKEETNTFLNAKQDTLADGNGVKIENDEISVDLSSDQSQLLKFLNGQLVLQPFDIAYNELIRQELANSHIPNSLASKSYVDDLMSGATKWEFVSQLPTEDIDIHTIYFVPKESAETDNIYDEWVYAIQSRNPDVYDWELLGTSQVDLSNYYTKTESDNKYQPIIDSTHKVSADNIDDSQSTNKFVRIIQSTDTPPSSSSSSKYEVGTIWQKYSSSGFNLATLTNVYVCKGHSDFAFYPIEYQWEDITDHYSKSETYSKTETDTLLGGKQNTLSVSEKLSLSSDTLSTSANQVYYAQTNSDETINTNANFYSNIKQNDLIIKSSGYYGDNYYGGEIYRVNRINNGTLKLSQIKDTFTITGTPPTTATSSDTQYKIGDIIFSDNGNIYLCTNKTYANSTFTYTWRTYGASGGSYTFTDGLKESSGIVSLDIASGSKLLIDANDKLDVDLSNYYTKSRTYSKDNINAITLQKAFRNLSGASYVMYMYESRSVALDVSAYNTLKITALSTNDEYSYKLDSGTEQTFDETDLPLTIDVSNASSFYAWGGAFGNESLTYDLTNNDFDYATTTDLSSKQDTIDSTHKLSADLVDDTNTTNKFVSATEKATWNAKADNTTISTDTTSTTVSLTLADNHEYRYTQDLTSLTLTMPNGDFISSIVFASGSTPTSMTYDSNIKWSGDDVTNGQFVPSEKTYNIVMWYDGLNINGVVRGV